MTSFDVAAGAVQDDWLSGLMVADEPKQTAPVVVAQPPAAPVVVAPSMAADVAPPPVPVQVPMSMPAASAVAGTTTPPPVPVVAPMLISADRETINRAGVAPVVATPAPAAGDNWLAMVMPEAAGHGAGSPINAGPSLAERLKLGERTKRAAAMLKNFAARLRPYFKRQFVLPFVLGVATMYGGEVALRYVFPPKPVNPIPQVDPKPQPPVKPDKQVVVPPAKVDPPVVPNPPVKPDNTAANNNPTNTNVIPVSPVDPLRPSPWASLFPTKVPTDATQTDWFIPPPPNFPLNPPAINPPGVNPQNPWKLPNDFQNLFNPPHRQ